MKAKMTATTANHMRNSLEPSPAKRPVSLMVSQLAAESLQGDRQNGAPGALSRLEIAVRCYLRDREAGQSAWPYPAFLRGSETREEVRLEVSIDDELWQLFEAEALRQQVSVQQLSEHAAFYFAAELEAGRLTQRILDDLEATEVEAEAS